MKSILVALAFVSLALAGCTGTPANEYATPAQDDQGRYVIKMLPSNQFEPKKAQVPAGATVVWMNEGGNHNTENGGGLWASPVNNEPENFEYTFNEVGEYPYHCKPHESLGMTGVIKVV